MFGLFQNKISKTGGREIGRRMTKRTESGETEPRLRLSWNREKANIWEGKTKGRAKQTMKMSRKWTKESSCWLTCEGMKACLYHFIFSSAADATHSISPQETGLVVREPRVSLIPATSHLCWVSISARVMGDGGVCFIYLFHVGTL